MKERCKVSSSQPFDWTLLSGGAEHAAVERFAQFGGQQSYDERDEEELDGTDFAEALMHWRFPESPLPPSLRKTFARNIAGGGAARDRNRHDDKQYCLARLEEWGSAFRSLYRAFTEDRCSEVYVTSKMFTVVFAKRKPGDRHAGKDGYCAVLTRSSRGLRQRLEDEFVEFELPCEVASPGGVSDSDASRDGVVDQDDEEEHRRFLAGADSDTIFKSLGHDVRDNTPSSLVVAPGLDGVKGVYDFFLNYVKAGDGELDDVPSLYATCPFYRATIGQARWENLGETQSGGARAASRPVAASYMLDIEGLLLPGNLRKLFAELNRRQTRGFSARLKTVDLMKGVNMAFGTPENWEAAVNADEDEAANRRGEGDVLVTIPSNHVISKVECVNGKYAVQASSTGNA